MQKVFRISCKYKNHENYSILTPFKGLSRLGTRRVVVLLCDMRPHAIRDLETYSMSCWCLTGIDNIMQSYALIFCGIEHSLLLGWSVSVTGWAVRSHAVYMWSFLQDRDRAGYIAIRSVNRSVPWLAPIKFGADPKFIWDAECAIPFSLEVDFWELQPWVPNISYALKRLPLTYLENKKEH